MAFATQLTIGTGSKVSANYQSHEVSVIVTYELERQDTDLLKLVEEKAAEVEQAHSMVWRSIKSLRTEGKTENPSPPVSTQDKLDESETNTEQTPDGHNGAVPTEAAGIAQNGDARQSNGASPTEPMISGPQQRAVAALATRAQMSDEDLQRRLQMRFGKSAVGDLTKRQASMLLTELQRGEREKEHACTG